MQDLDTLLRLYSRNGIPSVMLKGISISSQFYKQPHQREMGDMDLLVKTQDLHKARHLAKAAGFVESANVGNCKIPSSHHHLPQLRAPISNFAFEIHSGLFPPTTVADRLSCFSVDQAWKQVIYGTEYDCMVGRFTPQFQFTYTVAHWAADSKWAINIHSIIDSICLLTNPGHKVDWNYVRQAMDQSPWLARVISVLLIYLEDARLAEMPLELRSVVNQARLSLGEFNVRLLHWLIDEFVMRGRSHAAIFLNQRWSAATFWTLMLEPETAGIRIPTAAIGSFLSDRNVFNPLRIIRRASELISIRRN
jgi:hypothetical protein